MRTLIRLVTPNADKVSGRVFGGGRGEKGRLRRHHPSRSPPLPLPQVDDFLAAKNSLFAALTEIDDLLDEVGVRLQREGEDLEIKLKAKQVSLEGGGGRGRAFLCVRLSSTPTPLHNTPTHSHMPPPPPPPLPFHSG